MTYQLATARQWVTAPVFDPPDAASWPVWLAVVPEGTGEPADSDYRPAEWLTVDGEVRAGRLPGAGEYPPGLYALYTRVVTPDQDIRRLGGRLRVGDARA